jgi:hypothetical protein
MHNWLIFQYHRVRVRANVWLLRGCLFGDEPTHRTAASRRRTQEDR